MQAKGFVSFLQATSTECGERSPHRHGVCIHDVDGCKDHCSGLLVHYFSGCLLQDRTAEFLLQYPHVGWLVDWLVPVLGWTDAHYVLQNPSCCHIALVKIFVHAGVTAGMLRIGLW
jgi:hypothetical protein